MKLVHSELGIKIVIVENRANVLVIENPMIFRKIIEDVLNQINGFDGELVLSTDDKILALSKHIELVIDPFNIDLNSKKIQGKLFQLIKQDFEENFAAEINDANTVILELIDSILAKQPFSVGFDAELDFLSLLKSYHVEFKANEMSFLEILVEFTRVHSQLMGTKIIMFCNLKSYLSENELMQFYEFAFYSKINLILLENSFRTKNFNESTIVIDSDCCIIDI